LVISGTSGDTAYAFDSAAESLAEKITFRNEKLTAKLTPTSLREVMAAISQVSGVHVCWLTAGAEEPVTVDLVALPLSEAVPRLLGERNFLLFYSSPAEGARLTQVWISSRKPGGTRLALPQGPLPQQQSLTPSTDDTTEEAAIPPDMLLQTALYDRGVSARLEAIAQVGEYAQQDPRITAALSHLADNDHEVQVREAAAAVLETIE
jgi:hypothetical protein